MEDLWETIDNLWNILVKNHAWNDHTTFAEYPKNFLIVVKFRLQLLKTKLR